MPREYDFYHDEKLYFIISLKSGLIANQLLFGLRKKINNSLEKFECN